jgi:hypothetical protein
VDQTEKYCPACDRAVLATEKPLDRQFHAMVCVFTLMLWFPFFLALSVRSWFVEDWLCPHCGGRCERVPRYLPTRRFECRYCGARMATSLPPGRLVPCRECGRSITIPRRRRRD